MKAIICSKYGPPENLKLLDVPKPIPEKDEILIKVKATAVNDFDWSLVTGKPAIYRMLFGLLKPRTPIPGIELSGTVVEKGNEVSNFNIGDEVYGDISDSGWGSFAEFVCVKPQAMVLKPKKMSFVDAAAIPHASMLAYQGLVEIGNIQDEERVLINGAGGGVGVFGMQIAKLYDADVTGVDSEDKLEQMKSWGYDNVIDYRKKDFTKMGEQYDLILDTKSNRPPSAYKRALKPGGRYVTVGGDLMRVLQIVLQDKVWKNPLSVVALKPGKDLALMNHWFEEGKIKPIIDGPYPLEKAPELLSYFGKGQHKGKVIMTLG
jgi:NADPH:quinone reductase-like Zn-dependent oxidoreductase